MLLCPLCRWPEHHETPGSAGHRAAVSTDSLCSAIRCRVSTRTTSQARSNCSASARTKAASSLEACPRSPCSTCRTLRTIPSASRCARSVRISAVESAPPDTATQTRSPGSKQGRIESQRRRLGDVLACILYGFPGHGFAGRFNPAPPVLCMVSPPEQSARRAAKHCRPHAVRTVGRSGILQLSCRFSSYFPQQALERAW